MTHQDNTPKIAVVTGVIVCSILCMGLIVKQAINANKAPKIQKVQIVNYSEILEAVENEKKEIIDSIKNEIKDLKIQNEMLLAKANVKPKVIVLKEKEVEIKTNQTNQIVVSKSYVPHVQILQKKSGNLEIIE
jgi:hypothetical protein